MSEQPKWTPGPWKVRPSSEYSGHYVIESLDGIHFPVEQDKANARLIARAPELYADLKTLLETLAVMQQYVLFNMPIVKKCQGTLAEIRGDA